MKELIEALQILLKYENPTYPTWCEHDTLHICEIDPTKVSQEEMVVEIIERGKMETAEHKDRHVLLHKMFDELAADFISQTGKRLSNTTCMELLQWSHAQTISPTDPKQYEQPEA